MKTLTFALCLLLVGPAFAELRTWTSIDGRTIEGELVGKTEEVATIKRSDGAAVDVPLKMLSPKDQAYVKSAEIAAPAPGLKETVLKFFAIRERGEASPIDQVLQLPEARRVSRTESHAGAWAARLKKLEGLAKDTPEDKMILIEVRRASAALLKAQSDKSSAAEAVRALDSLKAAALK
jgi:hypothetical protein